jgi:hypothetical protein
MNTKFEFLTGDISHSLRFSCGHYLYNLPEYMNTWPDQKSYSFFILQKAKNQIAGYIRFQIINGTAYSPYRAPFGSFTISEEVNYEVLNAFNAFIVDHFKNIGINKIRIKHYPGFYQPQTNELIIASMGLNGFRVITVDINHYIDVSSSPFSTFLHPMELRHLNKCKKSGTVFNVHQNTEVELLFSYIESFRNSRKIPLNINLSTLMTLFKRFPDNYKGCSVSLHKEIIAATVIVQVNDLVLYNFLPAHNEVYNNYSPMVFLINELYEYADSHNFKYIDLGISSKDGLAQPGLIKFKERLGAHSASKFTLIKEIR